MVSSARRIINVNPFYYPLRYHGDVTYLSSFMMFTLFSIRMLGFVVNLSHLSSKVTLMSNLNFCHE